MSERSRIWTAVTGLFVLGGAQALAQTVVPLRAAPATSAGFELPRVSGTLTYGVSLSESFNVGYSGTDATTDSTNVAVHVGFISPSVKQPFSLIYSGAYLAGGMGQPSSFLHNLSLSQVLVYRRFSVVVSDAVSYLPSSPVSGLSGVPGLGDQGLQGPGDGTTLLSQYSPRVTNTAAGSVAYQFTGRTSLAGSGSYQLLRTTTDGAGVDSNTASGGVGLTYLLNRVSSMSVNGYVSRYTYIAYALTYVSEGATFEYQRRWSPVFSTDVSAGPEYSTSSSVPSTLNYSFNASANYALRKGSLSATAVRATNAGSGVTLTSRSTSATVSATRRLGEFSSLAANAGYVHNASLPSLLTTPFTTDSATASVQGSRSISRALSVFGSYTLQHQLSGQNGLTVSALNGTTQTFSFGVTYAPRPYIVGR